MIDTKLHDAYCRCRVCKPPLVGEHGSKQDRFIIGALGIGLLIFALAIYRALPL